MGLARQTPYYDARVAPIRPAKGESLPGGLIAQGPGWSRP
jgi:hypothetical protein